MSLSEKMMKQGSLPTGLLGRVIGYLMNLTHKKTYLWGLSSISFDKNMSALDIGCGGGKVVRLLAERQPGGKVCGIDHSPEMVDLAGRVNKDFIKSGQVEIKHSSVSSLPFQDNMFDVVTAFETIQFWPNLCEAIQEIKRVLQPSGKLLVVNRFPDLQGKDASWVEMLQIRSSEEYHEVLTAAGFVDITMDHKSNSGWILVLSKKL